MRVIVDLKGRGLEGGGDLNSHREILALILRERRQHACFRTERKHRRRDGGHKLTFDRMASSMGVVDEDMVDSWRTGGKPKA